MQSPLLLTISNVPGLLAQHTIRSISGPSKSVQLRVVMRLVGVGGETLLSWVR
jgi:hypothetical protein